MTVKKTTAAKKVAAKKTAPAKKTAAKSAAPALAKKVAATKAKTPAKKAAPATAADDAHREEALADRICQAIVEGEFDPYLVKLDDALNDRINKRAVAKRAESKATPAKTAEKKVAAAPKRTSSEPLELKSGQTYQIVESVKNIGGAKVKFHRFKVDSPDRAVIEMMEDRGGYPKGKRVSIPVKSLVAIAAKRTPAKRSK